MHEYPAILPRNLKSKRSDKLLIVSIRSRKCLPGLGVSAHSLYKWVKAVAPDKSEQHATELNDAKSEILRLRAQLRRIEEERDILKKAARYFAREPE